MRTPKDSLTLGFGQGVAFQTIGQVISVFAALASSVILARWLGPDQRGVLAMTLLLPTSTVAICASGCNASIVYFVSSARWSDDVLLCRILALGMVFGSLAMALSLLAITVHETVFPNIPLHWLSAALALIPLQLTNDFMASILMGKQAFRLRMICSILSGIIGITLTVSLVIVCGLGLVGAFASTLIAQLATAVLLTLAVTQFVPGFFTAASLRFELADLKDAMGYAGKAHLGNLMQFLNYRFDVLLINLLLGPAAVGVYVVATGIGEKLWLLASNTATVLFPIVAKQENNETQKILLTNRAAAITGCIMLATSITLAALAIPVVAAVYGQQYTQSAIVLIALLPGIAMLGYSKILTSYISGNGEPGRNAWGAFFGLVVNVFANLIMIPKYGIAGAAYATSLSYSVTTLYAYYSFVTLSGTHWSSPLLLASADWKLLAITATDLLSRTSAFTRHRRS